MSRIINQFVPSVHAYDAVGSTALELDRVFHEFGYDTRIYALYRDPVLARKVFLFRRDTAPKVEADINILHFALPSPLTDFFRNCGGQRAVIYHNITPPQFFRGYQDELAEFTKQGLSEIATLVESDVRAVAYSEFSAHDLRTMGFREPIVLPFLLNWRNYDWTENRVLKTMLSDGWTNLLFVGRLVPNKRQDNLVRLLSVFRKRYRRRTRLVLVGKGREGDTLHHELLHLVRELGNQPVLISGRVTPADMVTYYRTAHVFVSLSEHEGFCVPLVEAMFFRIPILAYSAAAIPDTLKDSGLLLEKLDLEYASAILDRLLNDAHLRKQVLESQDRRLHDFLPEQAIPCWKNFIRSVD
ncbi:glycosyltransferase family 4 protein [bacterium]|nr:glycosyltransferase family 4 protein [bacterium]